MSWYNLNFCPTKSMPRPTFFFIYLVYLLGILKRAGQSINSVIRHVKNMSLCTLGMPFFRRRTPREVVGVKGLLCYVLERLTKYLYFFSQKPKVSEMCWASNRGVVGLTQEGRCLTMDFRSGCTLMSPEAPFKYEDT